MAKKQEHKINFTLEETTKKTEDGLMVGMGCDMKYVGDEDDITPSMALVCIGALMKRGFNADENYVENILQAMAEKFVSKNAAVVSAGGFDDAEKKAIKKHNKNKKKFNSESASDMFMRLAKDKNWIKIFSGKSNLDLSDTKNKHVLAWVCTALNVIADLQETRNGHYEWLEELFLKDIAGVKTDDNDEDDENEED